MPRIPAKVFQIVAALVPEHRHEGQDGVGLIERDALNVNADENLRHHFLVTVEDSSSAVNG